MRNGIYRASRWIKAWSSLAAALMTLSYCAASPQSSGETPDASKQNQEQKSKGKTAQQNSLAKPESSAHRSAEIEQLVFLLDQLSDEARRLQNESMRPKVMAEIADAFWSVDATKSADLFTSALEAALALKPGKEASEAIRGVIAMAARRDGALGARLNQRLTEQRQKEGRSVSEAVGAAIDLLKYDSARAAQLAEAAAPSGLTNDSAAHLIFQLAEQDIVAAEKVYSAYLNKCALSANIPLGQVLWLAGFGLGYGEAYGFSNNDPARFMGFGGRNVGGLTSNPALARTFLDLALRSVTETLNRANNSAAPVRSALSGLALFATTYLFPEAARYQSERLSEWKVLNDQAVGGASEAQQQQAAGQIQVVLNNRLIAMKKRQSSEANSSERIDVAIERGDKAPEGCERDRAYAEAAISIAFSKDNIRALAVAEKIKDTSLKETVHQYLYYDLAGAAIERGDWQTAQGYVERVSAKDNRTLLYVKLAQSAVNRKDRTRANEWLIETRRLAEGVADSEGKVATLLAAAAVLVQFDRIQTEEVLREAIKALNRSEAVNVDKFSILRQIDLACQNDVKGRFFGNADQAERFSLLDTMALFSASDRDGSIMLARGIQEPATRVRTLTAIVKAHLAHQESEKKSAVN